MVGNIFIERIGVGAFGSVSKYFDSKSRRNVAAKHISEDIYYASEEVHLAELALESSGATNIVRIFDFFMMAPFPLS